MPESDHRPYKSYQPTLQFRVTPEEEIPTLDTEHLDRLQVEARYRQFVDSVETVQTEDIIPMPHFHEMPQEAVIQATISDAAHALAHYLLQNIDGLVRLDIRKDSEHSLEPCAMRVRLRLPVIRPQGVRDTFTHQLEKEYRRGKVEGIRETLSRVGRFVRTWASRVDPDYISRKVVLEELGECDNRL